jgi:hypothetical protein
MTTMTTTNGQIRATTTMTMSIMQTAIELYSIPTMTRTTNTMTSLTVFVYLFSFASRTSMIEHDDEQPLSNNETHVDDDDLTGESKPFVCVMCAVSFSKFDVYRDHFMSSEHRYKRRDEKMFVLLFRLYFQGGQCDC